MTTFVHRLPVVKARTGMCRTSIYAAIKAGTFPAPIKLGKRAVGWTDVAIDHWIATRPGPGSAGPGMAAEKEASK